MTGYELSRAWFDFSFENPEKIKPIHTAIYFFAIEHCNRLGWKLKFGFPSQMVMEAIGVKNWRTYSKGLNDLLEFGFIEMIEKSTNQYSSNIIAIVKNTKAHTKALDKALSKHRTKQSQSTVSIDKQYNKEQYNKEQELSTSETIDLKNNKDFRLTEIAKFVNNDLVTFFNLKEGGISTAFQFINQLNGEFETFKNQFYDYRAFQKETKQHKKGFKGFTNDWNSTDYKKALSDVKETTFVDEYKHMDSQQSKKINGKTIYRVIKGENGKPTLNKNF